MNSSHAALATILSATRGRVRAALPADRDTELCAGTCYEPRMCGTPGKCWVTEVLAKAARLRAALGPPGRQSLDPVGLYLARSAKKRSAS